MIYDKSGQAFPPQFANKDIYLFLPSRAAAADDPALVVLPMLLCNSDYCCPKMFLISPLLTLTTLALLSSSSFLSCSQPWNRGRIEQG
jgi:hypothetical protein